MYGSVNGTLWTLRQPGPTLTAAATASMLVAASPAADQIKPTLPLGALQRGTMLRFRAWGLISCVVTTPGTARYAILLNSVNVWDSQAIPLNATAQTNDWWQLEVNMVVRQEGTTSLALLWGQGTWLSPAAVNTAAPATGPGPGGEMLPYGATSGLSGTLGSTAGFDSSIQLPFDCQFTQTVATGSMTCEMAELTTLN